MERHWRELARLIGLRVPSRLHRAFNYLEANGLRFCVDFGMQNAKDKARDHWNKRKRKTNRQVIH